MSLFSSIQQASNSLQAAQIGLQVVGQNIANASTPGYTREEVILSPAPTQKLGGLLLGMGVEVKGVVQKIDKFLDERLRGAVSDRVSSEVQEQAYLTLEGLIGELSDTDLSTSLNNFIGAVSEVVNQPEDVSIRALAAHQGATLAGDIRRLASRVQNQRSNLNTQVVRAADDINRLTEEIRVLNRIAAAEGGDVSASDAVGLRDQRHVALTQLAELINVKVTEQESGTVNVFTGGDFLVFDGQRREVSAVLSSDRGLPIADIELSATGAPLAITGGEVGGLVAGRDTILGGFLDRLEKFATTLAYEFNKVYSSGQGLVGHDEVTAQFAVDATDRPLDEAGLPFTPTNGAFQLQVFDVQTGVTQTSVIHVDLNGLDEDTTLSNLAATLGAVDGISASVSLSGVLSLAGDSPNIRIAFADDTSGILAALGMNSFFSGSSAFDLGVYAEVLDDPATFAASRSGVGQDNDNAVLMAGFLDQPLDTAGGSSILVMYDRMIGETTQASTVARGVAEGFRVFEETLQGQRLATSGVNLDEEAVRMITLQRTYQASARYIAAIAELLDVLVNL